MPNFLRMRDPALYSEQMAKQGDYDYVDSLASDLRGLSKDMDGIYESIMDYVDLDIKQRYFENLRKAHIEGNNIL